jgi:hypothetical protein
LRAILVFAGLQLGLATAGRAMNWPV